MLLKKEDAQRRWCVRGWAMYSDRALEFQKIVENVNLKSAKTIGGDTCPKELARKSKKFRKILEVPRKIVKAGMGPK